MAQIQICRGFGDKDWEELSKRLVKDNIIQLNEPDWQRAIDIFERRMRERFFSCIKELEDILGSTYTVIPDTPNPDRPLPDEDTTTPGFSIMALCCLLVDTLQFFRAGKPSPTRPPTCPSTGTCAGEYPGTNKAFKAFLTECLSWEDKDAKAFVNGIRNGILHQAETRGWLIERTIPVDRTIACESKPFILNRTRFCNELRDWFDSYLQQLRRTTQEGPRRLLVAGMDHVVEKCRKIS